MARDDVYNQLAEHLSRLPMGYPFREGLVDILKENFSPDEAETVLAIPTDTIPLRAIPVEEILKNTDCIGVGKHQSRSPWTCCLLKGIQVHKSFLAGRNNDHLVPSHCS